jgi:hypothetical protein
MVPAVSLSPARSGSASLSAAGLRRWSGPAALVTCLVLLTAYFCRLSLAHTTNAADIAGLMLCAQDLVRGNWLLHGWMLGTDSLWLTDMLVYAAGVAARGLDPALLHLVPALMSVALVAVAAGAAMAGRGARLAIPAALLAVLPLLFPSAMMLEVLMGPFHTGAILAALGAAVALFYAQDGVVTPRGRWWMVGVAFLLLSVGTFSDPYTSVLASVPIALASVLRTLAAGRPDERLRRLLPLLAVAGGWYGAAAIAWWVRVLNGAAIVPFSPATLPYAKMGVSLANLVLALLRLGGGDVFGRPLDSSLLSAGLRAGYIAAGGLATWCVLRDEARDAAAGRTPKDDWLTLVLAVSAGVALIANVLGTAELNTRYRLPLLVMMSLVAARRFGAFGWEWIEGRKTLAAALAVLVVLAYPGAWAHYLNPYAPKRPSGFAVLGRWLEAHGLDDGVGGYWEASIVTVESRGAVRVRPVVSTKVYQPGLGPSGLPPASWRLTRIKMSSKDAWYGPVRSPFFVVFDASSDWDRVTGVDREVAARTYGPPRHVYHVDRFTVLVWDQPN